MPDLPEKITAQDILGLEECGTAYVDRRETETNAEPDAAQISD